MKGLDPMEPLEWDTDGQHMAFRVWCCGLTSKWLLFGGGVVLGRHAVMTRCCVQPPV